MATRKKADTSKQAEVDEKETTADKIWNKIKDLPIDIFALPNQVVQKHAERTPKMEKVNPDAVFLLLKSAAVRPALEESLGKVRLGRNDLGQPLTFDVSTNHVYTVVQIVPRDI